MKRLASIVVLFFFFFPACAPVYLPNSRPAYFLNHQGQIVGNIDLGSNGVDVGAAYAATQHIGIMASGSFYQSKKNHNSPNHQKHQYGEIGIDYFTKLGKYGVWETVGGIGKGTGSALEYYDFISSTQKVQATGHYNKLFISSDIGLRTKTIDLGLSLRLGNVMFTKFQTNSATYSNNKSALFWEPAAVVRVGGKNIKLESQIGFSKPFDENLAFQYEPIFWTFGLNFNFSTY